MNHTEQPLVFSCQNESLIGILHKPESSNPDAPGVLVVVGGPQYRVGSHRQFVLLARHLCAQGIAVFRFDYRGIGDSSGRQRCFDAISQDIHAALSEFNKQLPNIKKFVIWGLCDAASAAAFYAHTDTRIVGLVLLNPWVHTDAGEAKVYLKSYYVKRLLSGDLWKKIFLGKFQLYSSLRSLSNYFRLSLGRQSVTNELPNTDHSKYRSASLPNVMAKCLKSFTGQVLVILSGNNDYVAAEFKALLQNSRSWKSLKARPSVKLQYFDQANHTFSRQDWRQQVEFWTHDWIRKL